MDYEKRTPHYAGELAYVDTLTHGLLPCKVVAVDTEAKSVTVRLTADRGAYKRGEILTEPRDHVVPRTSVYVRDGRYQIRNNYRWEAK